MSPHTTLSITRPLPLPGVYRGTVGKCVRCESSLPREPASGLAAYFCTPCYKRVAPEGERVRPDWRPSPDDD